MKHLIPFFIEKKKITTALGWPLNKLCQMNASARVHDEICNSSRVQQGHFCIFIYIRAFKAISLFLFLSLLHHCCEVSTRTHFYYFGLFCIDLNKGGTAYDHTKHSNKVLSRLPQMMLLNILGINYIDVFVLYN